MFDRVMFSHFIKVEPIEKGWSGDKKYYVEDEAGQLFLLRVSEIAQYDRKKTEYEMMQKVAALGVPMQQPVDFGVCNDGKSVYILLTWIDGEDAETLLPLLPETEQYILGLKSGEILRQIHSIAAPDSQEDWEAFFNRKTNRRVETYQKYKEQALTSQGDEHFLSYVENNRHLLKNRPQCYQHGDYHPGNMIIAPDGSLFIIDWNRFDFGDPWEEFNRITFTAHTSPHFATGQLMGYFDGSPPRELGVPELFFRLLAFYIASNQLGVIGWALPFGKSEVHFAKKQNEEVLRWYENMQNTVPSWYIKDFYIQWIDGVPLKLKAPFDFSFLRKYGTVFKVFDDQDSGNICFGVANPRSGEDETGKRYFVKFAGAPTANYDGAAEDAIARLKPTPQIYRDLAHPMLIKLVNAEDIGGGFAVVYEWVDAICAMRMYPKDYLRFKAVPLAAKVRIFEDVMDFHAHVAERGYVAIDFYDGSIMYDVVNERTIICDIDFYEKSPYVGAMGMWGSARFVSPEERTDGAVIDEVTNVYTMGATAFCLLAHSDRTKEAWPLSERQYDVVIRAVSDNREDRQQSIRQLMDEWKTE